MCLFTPRLWIVLPHHLKHSFLSFRRQTKMSTAELLNIGTLSFGDLALSLRTPLPGTFGSRNTAFVSPCPSPSMTVTLILCPWSSFCLKYPPFCTSPGLLLSLCYSSTKESFPPWEATPPPGWDLSLSDPHVCWGDQAVALPCPKLAGGKMIWNTLMFKKSWFLVTLSSAWQNLTFISQRVIAAECYLWILICI